MGEGDTLINAVLGAVVTVVLSFTVFSPLLGGGVAGYLQRGQRRDGIRVGVLSGALAVIPFLFLISIFGGFIFTGTMMGPGMGVPGATAFVFIFGTIVALVWNVGLSAFGGYLGVYVATETEIGT